mmetsp:Transcript_13857/g.20289  ORF Transcript_13857/g.20289 Transcript_13857/m.20289 type:complete len:109 (+) Transcript_13857:40-366(+)
MAEKENLELVQSVAKGLSLGAVLKPDLYAGKGPLTRAILDGALKNSMTGQQRVQSAFNNFLWFALNVKDGEDGLTGYVSGSMFENSKKMKSLYSKVLVRIKDLDVDEM